MITETTLLQVSVTLETSRKKLDRIDASARRAEEYRRKVRTVKCPCTHCQDVAGYYERQFELFANDAASIAVALRLASPIHADVVPLQTSEAA